MKSSIISDVTPGYSRGQNHFGGNMARETLFPPKLSYFKAAFFKSQEFLKIFLSPHDWTACPFLAAYAAIPPPVG